MNYNDIEMVNSSVVFKNVGNFSSKQNLKIQLKSFEEVILHSHEFLEFFYVVKGSCTHVIDGKEEFIENGDFYFIPIGCAHTFKNSTPNFLHRDIIVKRNFFVKLIALYSFFDVDKLFHTKINPQDVDVSEHLCTYINNKDKDAEKILINHLLILIYKYKTINKKISISWISTLTSMLNSHSYFNKSMNEILSTIDYSNEHIRREFKKHVGSSITDYWNSQKLHYAYKLLKNTNLTINEICERINFQNQTYFYRLFKKMFNKTPKEVR